MHLELRVISLALQYVSIVHLTLKLFNRVNGFKEAEAEGVVDLVGALDDCGSEVLVFHFFGTDFTDGADDTVFLCCFVVAVRIQALEFSLRTILRRGWAPVC
jgi:hypothetical protein